MSKAPLDKKLRELGLVAFDEIQLKRSLEFATEAIVTGLKREGKPTEMDGGVLAIDSGISPKYRKHLPAEGRVAVCDLGGTNWRSGWADVVAGEMMLSLNENKVFERHQRRFSSPEEFASEIISCAVKANGSELPSGLAISFAFQCITRPHEKGIDAIVPLDEPAKYWNIRGLAGRSLIDLLLEAAHWANWSLEKIVIANDTVGTLLDNPKSTLGFVAGTGTNGSMAHPGYKQGRIVNLESGRLTVFPYMPLINLAKEKGLLVEDTHIAEYFTGGDYLLEQFTVAIDELNEYISCTTKQLDNEVGAAVLDYAALEDLHKLEEVFHQDISGEDLVVLSQVARIVLERAGQVIGVTHAAMLAIDNAPLPKMAIEGSVYWKGYGVQEAVHATVNLLVEETADYIEVSGVRGIAKYLFSLMN